MELHRLEAQLTRISMLRSEMSQEKMFDRNAARRAAICKQNSV
jgi:hypothetical protein